MYFQNLKSTLLLALSLFAVSGFAQQNGFIRGTVYEEASNQTMPSVKVFVPDTEVRGITDLDGQFSLSVPPGTYSLELRFIMCETIIIKDVVVTADDATVVDDIYMREADNELTTVVILKERNRSSENAVLNMKKTAVGMIDGISSANFRKIGDSNAAGAMARVPGVSIAGGKYVYVRGLGDRYNKTLLNGMDVPGLDPDRNTIQMDIFPTSILDNIIVNKTFVAELPADFTGGVIDITLKSFPEEQQRSFSVSGAYNPYFHFQNDYLTYKGGSTDFLGFDDGTREIPATTNIPFFADAIGDEQKAERYQDILGRFNPTMSTMKTRSLMDAGASVSFGNQFKKDKYTIGYNVIGSYKNSTEFYRDAEFGRYGLAGNSDSTKMQTRERQVGNYGVNNVLITGMAGFAIKTNTAKYTMNLLHLQNGESKAGVFDYYNSDQGAVFEGFQHNLEYSQRSLTNLLITGKHSPLDSPWETEWRVAPTLSLIKDPDIRFTRYENRNDSLIIGTEAGFPERIWRDLNERNLSGKVGATRKFKAWGRDSKLKFGAAYTYKVRDFVIRNFALNVRNVNLTGNPDELFADENIWPVNGDVTKGTTYEVSFLPANPNQYNSNVNNAAAYLSTELSPWERISTTFGVRVENYVQRYTGQDQLGINKFANDIVLNNLGIYPSFNFTFKADKRQNWRFSYGKTVARPSFKELSYAEIYDPVTGRTFIGGLFRDEDATSGQVYWDGQLESTDIHNFDVRYEFFPQPGQTVSVTAFYKKFYNPIEIVQFSAQTGSFQPRNVGDGEVIGGEFELRQTLKKLGEKFENFSFNVNVTYTASRIQYSATEKESRVANARTGQTIGDYRDMAGQAPYLINGGFSYNGGTEGFWKGFEAGMYYNVQGQTLQFVGIVDRPDIYTVPFHSLNFNSNKTFGEKDKFLIGLKVNNILNDKKESVFRSFQAEDQYFSRLSPGTTVSLKFRMNF